MKKFAFLITALLVSHVTSAVTIVDMVDENQCKLIKEADCTTAKREGLKVCTEKHLEGANRLQADTLLLGEVKEMEHRKPSLTGAKKVRLTQVQAYYYQCETAQEKANTPMSSPAMKGIAPAAKSIEDRLVQLNSLKDKGLITQEEYKSKRTEILNEL